MRKWSFLLILGVFSLALVGCDACKESVFSKLGDTVATIGKKGVEKDKVLATRAAERAAKCAEQKGAEMKKKIVL